MTHPIAALIAGVPRYRVHPKRPNVMFASDDGGWLSRDAVLAALEAAPPMGVKVKPLVWKQAGGNIKDGEGFSAWGHLSRAPTTIYMTRNGWWLSVDCKTYPNLDAAQAAAQADYETRVLAALEAVPVPPDLMEAGKVADRLENADPFQFPFSAADAELNAADTIRALIALCQAQAAQIAGLEKEGAALASWQCVFTDGKTGLVGDEYGNQFCQMQRRAEAVEAERDNLSDKLERERALTDGAHRRARAAEAKVAELEAHIEGVAKDTHKLLVAAETEAATLRAEVERLRGALGHIKSMTVHSGGEIHGVTAQHWKAAFEEAQEAALAALEGKA